MKPTDAKTVQAVSKSNREPMEFPVVVEALDWSPIGDTDFWKAEWRGCRVYVRELRFGWSWTWAHRSGRAAFATADEAKAAAQAALCGGAG